MKKVCSVLIITILCLGILSSCAPETAVTARQAKDKQSEADGGLWRYIKVYGADNELHEEYWGLFDVEITEGGNKVKFDMNGYRYIILKGEGERISIVEVGREAVLNYWESNGITPHDYGSIK